MSDKATTVYLNNDGFIDFADDEVGYEQTAQALKKIGVDWETVRDNGIRGYVNWLAGTQQSPRLTKPQLAFDLPVEAKDQNGNELTAFGVYAGIYEGFKGTARQVRDQLGHDMQLVNLVLLENNDIVLTFARE